MPTRAAVGWALLFSVPPGVGVTGYATMVIATGTVPPVALLAGGLTTVIIFGLVLASQQMGTAEDPAVLERVD